MQNEEKIISMPVREIEHLKVLLATWYSFLREESDNISQKNFSEYLKTPVIYNLEKDEIEMMFSGSEEILKKFREYVARQKS